MKYRNTSAKGWSVFLSLSLILFSLSNGTAQMQTVFLADDLTVQKAHETSVGPVLKPPVSSFDESIRAKENWARATRHKWIGLGISSGSVILSTQTSSLIPLLGYLAGGVLSLVGMIGEDVHKHRFSKSAVSDLEALQFEISRTPRKEQSSPADFDFLFPPIQYRPVTLEDLTAKTLVWFKDGDSPLLVEGEIISTSSRSSRVYVSISSELGQSRVPMGDVYIPLKK